MDYKKISGQNSFRNNYTKRISKNVAPNCFVTCLAGMVSLKLLSVSKDVLGSFLTTSGKKRVPQAPEKGREQTP